MIPTAHRSERWSAPPRLDCSGAMYASVPPMRACAVARGPLDLQLASASSAAMPKSSTLTVPLAGDEDVLRLEVAVHDVALVRAYERADHRHDQLHCRARAPASARPPPAGGSRPRGARAPCKACPSCSSASWMIDDVLVLAARRGARLAQEVAGQRRRAGEQQLDRDAPAEPHVAREIDDPHPAAPELANDLVLADPRARARTAPVCDRRRLRRAPRASPPVVLLLCAHRPRRCTILTLRPCSRKRSRSRAGRGADLDRARRARHRPRPISRRDRASRRRPTRRTPLGQGRSRGGAETGAAAVRGGEQALRELGARGGAGQVPRGAQGLGSPGHPLQRRGRAHQPGSAARREREPRARRCATATRHSIPRRTSRR